MPEKLWAAAVALATEFGVCPVARTLPVDYTALRKRVGARKGAASRP
jgi:hypothetical protein